MSEPKLCREMLDNLTAYVDGELAEALCAEIDRHLAECTDCHVVVDSLQRTISLYHAMPQPDLPESVRIRLYKTLNLEEYLTYRNE